MPKAVTLAPNGTDPVGHPMGCGRGDGEGVGGQEWPSLKQLAWPAELFSVLPWGPGQWLSPESKLGLLAAEPKDPTFIGKALNCD